MEFSDYSESKKTDKQLAQFNIQERIKELYEKGLSPEERYQYILRDPLISAWLRYVYAILTKVGDAPSHKAGFFNSYYIGRTNLLLDTYGNLHLCERSDFSMPVGEVNSGITGETDRGLAVYQGVLSGNSGTDGTYVFPGE